MAFEEGHGAEAGLLGHDTMRGSHRFDGFQHYKYPETVGNDTYTDGVNFNSNETSEYAIQRMNNISQTTSEPFMMFEFMKINQRDQDYEDRYQAAEKSYVDAVHASQAYNDLLEQYPTALGDNTEEDLSIKNQLAAAKKAAEDSMNVQTPVNGFMSIGLEAKRSYTGSICLYMPTDIQVNDTLTYTEDTRKFGGLFESVRDGTFNTDDVDTDQAVNTTTITALSAALGKKLGKKGAAMIGGLVGFGAGDIFTAEAQRSLGRKGNPNEYAAYTNTNLRTFTFTWTLLPDSEYESKQVAGLIKFFRMSAHAKKNGPLKITVPDEVITSFHGARDMIQLPPTFIESVGVTYNPNVSSFFRRNNSPVEVGLTVTLKEIVPIYTDDVKRGL
jgi:hypothetical protein